MATKKVGVISLGCDKNRVDTEKLISILKRKHEITNDINEAQIIIVNTCAFLASSREEAVSEIFSANELRRNGKLEKLIVTGCMPQKFVGEMFDAMPEADAMLGVSDYESINEIIDELYDNPCKRINAVGRPRGECGTDRVLTTDGYAYLKIADGCSNHCTYCLIPKIRGEYRSVPKNDLIEEAKKLGNVEELILVAQDVTAYGKDLEPKSSLPDLIRALSALDNVQGIRLLYCYPEGITDELIRELQGNAKMIRYLDIPLQHSSDRILKLMNRKGRGEDYLALIERLKREVNGIAIRSTFITGFPTESEEDFNNLVEFLKKAELFNAGFFAYSREEGTPAYKLDGQIARGVKTKRLKKLYSEQKKVVRKILKGLVGSIFGVLCEGFDENVLAYYGRAYFNAPDVDGKIYFFSDTPVAPSERVNVKILKATGYDLYGEKV